MKCHKDEFKGGVLFKIVSEYKKMSKEKITRNQKFKEDLKKELKVDKIKGVKEEYRGANEAVVR